MLNIEAKVTGSPEGIEKAKMERMVAMENAKRASALAAIDPQPDPVPAALQQLPHSTNVELKNSYEVVLTQILANADRDYNRQTELDDDYGVTKFRELRGPFAQASEQKRLAALAALQ